MGLTDRQGRIGEMVEHVDGNRGVEDPGPERQGGGVGLNHRRRMGTQHGPSSVQSHDPRSQPVWQRRPQGTFAATDVQDAPWVDADQQLSEQVVEAARGDQVLLGHPGRQAEPLGLAS
jgi:hypothetical protein